MPYSVENSEKTRNCLLQGISPFLTMFSSYISEVRLNAALCGNGLTTKVISWRSVTNMCFLDFLHQYLTKISFQSHQLLFSHASAKVKGASIGSRTHNHQVTSPTCSPLSHPGGAYGRRKKCNIYKMPYLHIDQSKFTNTNGCIHMKQFIKLAHLSKEKINMKVQLST